MLKMRRTSPLFLVKWQPDIAAHSAIFFSAHLYIHAMQLQLFLLKRLSESDPHIQEALLPGGHQITVEQVHMLRWMI